MANEHNDQTTETNQPAKVGRAVIVGSVVVLGTAVLVGLIFPALRKPLAAAVIASPIPPIHRLARLIDADEPPGLAATSLARAAVCLVRDRDAAQAVFLELELNRLHPRYPRQ